MQKITGDQITEFIRDVVPKESGGTDPNYYPVGDIDLTQVTMLAYTIVKRVAEIEGKDPITSLFITAFLMGREFADWAAKLGDLSLESFEDQMKGFSLDA